MSKTDGKNASGLLGRETTPFPKIKRFLFSLSSFSCCPHYLRTWYRLIMETQVAQRWQNSRPSKGAWVSLPEVTSYAIGSCSCSDQEVVLQLLNWLSSVMKTEFQFSPENSRRRPLCWCETTKSWWSIVIKIKNSFWTLLKFHASYKHPLNLRCNITREFQHLVWIPSTPFYCLNAWNSPSAVKFYE